LSWRFSYQWTLSIAVTVIFSMLIVATFPYWSSPPISVKVNGRSLRIFDKEIGFIARPDNIAERTDLAPADVHYRVITDRIGARVSRPEEQSPSHPDLLFIGDSFAWGHGMENEQTFAVGAAEMLGMGETNLAFPSYGTTQALQILERHANLRPRYIVYEVIKDALRRNLTSCAPSYFEFCLDYSHVVFGSDGTAAIAPPRSDGVARMLDHVEALTGRLSPTGWLAQGADEIYGLWLARNSADGLDPDQQRRAFAYLLRRMAGVAERIGSHLIVVYIPNRDIRPPPAEINSVVAEVGVDFLDTTGAFAAARDHGLYLNDGHPNAKGNAVIAGELAGFIRGKTH